MKLTDNDQHIVREWLSEKCGSLRCFCCGTASWVTGGSFVNVGYDLHTGNIFYHDGIPQVSIVCSNCGYIMSFSTAVIGVPREHVEGNPGIVDGSVESEGAAPH
jgi:hypothetical protein